MSLMDNPLDSISGLPLWEFPLLYLSSLLLVSTATSVTLVATPLSPVLRESEKRNNKVDFASKSMKPVVLTRLTGKCD